MPLLFSLTVSSAQSSQDTICYSESDARKIALLLIEGERCAELLEVAQIQAVVLDSIVGTYKNMELFYKAQVDLKQSEVNMRLSDMATWKRESKMWKRRTYGVGVLGAVAVALITFVSIR